LKTNILKYFLFTGFCVFLVACSVRKDTFMSRNSHALSTKYNILYNGGLALDKGIEEVKLNYKDNFWEILPIERMQVTEDQMGPAQPKNANFEIAETKATKAVQKHSMNIDGTEKNFQIDEAYLMLGKARYYDQRFIPALDAFNYILYKYPKSDKIYEAKIWREKTNIRLENDVLALNNLAKLLKDIKFKDQTFADANAIMAQAFLNLEEPDSAVVKLKLATEFTKSNEEKARYRFILGQLYDKLNYKDSAYAAYQSVIDMNRKSPRQYVINAHARQALQFDGKAGDTIAFLKKFNKLLKDRENRPYLDVLNHQMGLFYDNNKNYAQARKYYNASLDARSADEYMVGSNYRYLADINFNEAKYVAAGLYYDSTLVQLNTRSREFKSIQKKRENLVDVIKYEAIATVNDSILNIVAMSETDRNNYYNTYIEKLKKLDEIKKKQAEKQAREMEAMAANAGRGDDNGDIAERINKLKQEGNENNANPAGTTAPPAKSFGSQESTFYFYNPTTLAFGKTEFRKVWGNRAYAHNWRTASSRNTNSIAKEEGDDLDNSENVVADSKNEEIDIRYTTDFYLAQLPTDKKVIDSLAKERNFAYYQLGVIYKEKFREYKRAADKLEKLLENQPEERLVLPAMYHLYKIYEIIDADKALAMKGKIISQYPDSRYAQILGNANSESVAILSPEAAYNNLFKRYEQGDYKTALIDADASIDQYTGDESISKFELLKARIVGKLRGIEEYKKALNFVALNYPNSPEGKEAEALLGSEIPALSNLQFSSSETPSWKILYLAKEMNDKVTKNLVDKVKKFMTDRQLGKLSMSFDIYTEEYNFVVIHGMPSEEYAKGIASILKELKEYKIPDVPIIISGQNYEIVQMKKNIGDYLSNPALNPKSVTEQLPAKVKAAAPIPAGPPPRRAERNPAQNSEANPQAPLMPPGQNPGSKNQPEKSNERMSQPPSIGMPPASPDPKR
jgi:tetratricopeptide (TPR) repeat protein